MIKNEVKLHQVPVGKPFNPQRLRFDGTLSRDELVFCRQNAIALAFDPVQQGWVTLDCEEGEEALMTARSTRDKQPASVVGPVACTFRRWRQEDLPVYRALLDDPEIWAHLPEDYPDPLDTETARTLIDISIEGQHHDVRAIEFDGDPVGQVRLAFDTKVARDRADTAELSYWVGRRYWRRGIAKEAIARFSEQAFLQYPALNDIFAVVDDGNAASARALARSGFQRAGASENQAGATVFTKRRRA
ncbi:GNAT family N-acetyltransferase [Roseovarius atlanticus]|uniref:GNAT family N-acetyltransferase n=1 Tax=Roseovarius atlanticus TaxID=1641875 RepID=UPI00070AE3C5|nr:GNAT family N-acetyltransferase [Roseovarius atlanticus]